MRVMVIVKANKDSEAGVLPDGKMLTAMGKYNEKLVNAGVMLAGEGLQASSKGARVKFSGGKTTVKDGPFTESKELVAGFWIWQVKSIAEAIDWLKQAPFENGEEVGNPPGIRVGRFRRSVHGRIARAGRCDACKVRPRGKEELNLESNPIQQGKERLCALNPISPLKAAARRHSTSTRRPSAPKSRCSCGSERRRTSR